MPNPSQSSQQPEVEGRSAPRFRLEPVADVQAHGARWNGSIALVPVDGADDVEAHMPGRWRDPVPGAETEAHGARVVEVASIVLETLDGKQVGLEPAGPDDVEGHIGRWGTLVPDVEGHGFKLRDPAADVEGHGYRWRSPLADVEGHDAAADVTFRRMTITPAGGGDAIVLESAGPGPGGELTYRAVSGLSDVEAHGRYR
jgi:hypothetical protein